MKYEFTKISNDHKRLRDDVIVFDTCSEISVGKSVFLVGPARDSHTGVRLVNTSHVMSIKQVTPNTKEVTTFSGSIYQIKEIP